MASAYGGHTTLPTVSAGAEVNQCSGLTLTTIPAPQQQQLQQNNSNNLRLQQQQQQTDTELQLVETDNTSPLIVPQRLTQSNLLNNHLPPQNHQLNSGITDSEQLTSALDGRSNGSLNMHSSFALNSHNGRSSPTASGSSGGGSRSSAHSLPSHSPALHHQGQSYHSQVGALESCGSTTVVTSAAIMGRLTAGCVDTLGNNASTAGFSTVDNCGSDTLSLLQHHHPHSHHFSYASLPPPHHHHHHPHHHHHHHHHNPHHPHDAPPGLLDISTL